MKYFSTLILVFLFKPFLLFGQKLDSTLVMHMVDSLEECYDYYIERGNLDSFKICLDHAIVLVQDNLGAEHARLGYLFHSKGRVEIDLRQLDQAETDLLEALRIKEKRLGNGNRSYCYTLNELGNVFINKSMRLEAEKYYSRAKECLEHSGDTNHLWYGYTLNNLSLIYHETERLHLAETAMIKSIRIKEAQNEMDELNLSNSYSELVKIYAKLGEHIKSEQALAESRILLLKDTGPKNIHYYWKRNNLGMSYQMTGQWEKSELYFNEALAGKISFLGSNNPDVASAWLDLGNTLSSLSRYTEAQKAFLEALKIYTADSTMYKLDLAWILNNLGMVNITLNDLQAARSYTLRSLQKKEELFGMDNADWRGTYLNLMIIEFREGNRDFAETEFLNSLDYFRSHLPEMNWALVECLSNLVDMYCQENNFSAANLYLKELLHADRSSLQSVYRINTPSIISGYLNKTVKNIDRYFSLNHIPHENDLSYASTCYELALYYKGFLLEAMEKMRKSLADVPEYTGLTDAIRYNQYQLGFAYADIPPDKDVINQLEEEKKKLEYQFSSLTEPYHKIRPDVTQKEVYSCLGKQEVAIEVIRYRLNLIGPTDTFLYAALLIRPDDTIPVFIPLFEESEFYSLFPGSHQNTKSYIEHLYAPDAQKAHDRSLYDVLWKPLEAYLKDIQTLYFSPGGILHRLNLNAIAMPSGTLLSDHYTLIQLGSTRQIVEKNSIEVNNRDCFLAGGVTYEVDTTHQWSDTLKAESPTYSEHIDSDVLIADVTLRGGVWNPLPGTIKEIAGIDQVLKNVGVNPKFVDGTNATEEAIKLLSRGPSVTSSPWIMHLSTHGYFFPDAKDSISGSSNNREPVFKLSDHPMIRSGLILAGGNYAWKHGHPYKPGTEDGILTAYEISQMDLSNTELVVLSACETGLGDIEGNEGVFGLQRAFKIAGVKNLIMSLWKVPDAATAELMISFYKHWLEEKMTIRQALYTVQKELRDEGFEPYYWAGWVLVE